MVGELAAATRDFRPGIDRSLLAGRSRDGYSCDGDFTQTLDALNKFTAARGSIDEETQLSFHVYNKIHPLPVLGEEKDLKPPGAISIRTAVVAKLKETRK